MSLSYAFKQFLPNRFRCVPPFSSIRSFSSNMADSSVKVVDFENLKENVVGKKVILVDVREPQELKDDGKIINSVNVPLGEVAQAFQMKSDEFESKYGIQKPDTSSEFILSCKSGKRATNAYQTLKGLGYSNISVYSGSFLDWVKKGGPLDVKS